MCTLYRMRKSVAEVAATFGPIVGAGTNLPAFDEIYPGYEAPLLGRPKEAEAGGPALSLIRMPWGVPPPPNLGKRPVVNIRNLASPFWRPMLTNARARCLVPADSFCEWTGEPGAKRKVWFALKDRPLFAFAGLWRQTSEGPRFAFLTCAPNALVGAYHPKAMPVILRAEDHDAWLDGDAATAEALAVPYDAGAMELA
ncbi:MAG: SOS response-associated peptidase [Sphingomonadales bacterium]|nr:SOS response-associated peptidase [Sphingomonadales bacterium]